ncbi:MAG: hypothetical protein U0326_00765 [Polyangiales bacterium]
MRTRLTLALTLALAACDDATTAPPVTADAAPDVTADAVSDVARDTSVDDALADLVTPVDRSAPDVRDVTVADVTPRDVTASDVTASDVTASDVTATDVTATDVTARDVSATDVMATDAPVAVGPYPAGPYGNREGDILANLSWEGYQNLDGRAVSTTLPYGPMTLQTVRETGRHYALVHLSEFY